MPDKENYGRRKTDRIDANISRKYKGKEYSLIDIQNLIDANAQLAETIRNREKFIKQQEEILKNEGKLSHQQQVMYTSALEANKKAQEQLNQNDKRVTELTDNWNRYITDTMKNPSNSSDVMKSIIQQSNSNNKPMPKSISDLFRQSLTDVHNARQEKAVQNIYQNVAGNVTARYKRQGADFTDPEVIKKMNGEIQQETAKKASGALKKFSLGAELINVASNTFNAAVSKWTEIFNRGKTNQIRAYEDTFTNISVRNGVTREQYTGIGGAQWKLNNVLSDMGLRNNIASSDVQRMWDTMATNGIKIDMSSEERRAEITEKAIDNVLTKNIVPYLDTSTAQWDQLVSAQPELQKNIRGINRLNTDLVGNNYATKDLLQNILDDLQPIADSALNDLAMSAAGATTFINSMMDSGMDEATAKSLWTEYYKQQQYGAEILRSGTTNEKMSLVNATVNGINVMDSEDTPEALANIARTRLTTSNYGPGYGSTMDAIVQSSVNGSVGTDPRFAMWAYGKGNKAFDIINQAEANGNEAIELYKQYGENATNDFANDKNQTQEKLQNITVENLMNELAVVNEWLGNWAGVIETAIKGIGAILLTKIVGGIIGKGIGALTGLGTTTLSSGSGLGSLLGKAGPIAGGVATVAATVGAELLVMKAMSDYNDKEKENAKKYADENIDYYLDKREGTTHENDTTVAHNDAEGFYMGGTGKIATDDYEDIFRSWKHDTAGGFQYWWQKMFHPDKVKEPKEYNKWRIDDFLNYYGSLYNNEEDRAKVAFGMSAVLYAIGMGDSAKEYFGVSRDDVISYMNAEYDAGTIDNVSDYISSYGLGRGFVNKSGHEVDTDTISNTINGWFSTEDNHFHRQGLNMVPVDNYPAILHQGEAVLTAATANELRNLLDEYRDTTQQTANFDNIIRTQTQDLITKMDEIKQVMINSNSSIGNFVDTMQQTKAKEILYTSMKQVKSTKSF